MKRIKIWSDSPSSRQLEEIASSLKRGEIMLFPTDTLYAVGCDALNVKAIDRICALKGINPEKSNLSIICSDISMASDYCRIDNNAFRILKDNTPGPFTFLFKALSSLPKAFKGRKIVGIRIPECVVDREIAGRLGHPVLTTSIEYSNEDYAINPELIAEAYADKVDFMVEGEDGDILPSTIIDCTDGTPEVVRKGKGKLKL